MPSPMSRAQDGARLEPPLEVATPPNATALIIPNVSIPLHPPGHLLPDSTADMEASTAVYFRDGRHPHGKRHRSALVDEAPTSAVSTVLAIVSAEEDIRAALRSTDKRSVVRSATQLKASAAAGDAVTAQYLAKLFEEPARCEQDVYRLVDVARCRRALAQEVERFKRAVTSAPLARSSLEGNGTATERAKRVDELNSCLTAGQHRRYRGFVLEWLRHQPSPSAPPNSAEVLKVVQQEQRLFLEALRREAVSHSERLSSGRNTTTYAYLGSVLTSFAQYRRVHQMRQLLISFLNDAKRKKSEGRLLLGSAPVASASATSDVAEEDRHSGNVAHGSTDGPQQDGSHGATPLQLFQRRFPSLRVLQWHLVKLYNAHQNGVAVSFPNPQVRSVEVPSKEAAGALPHKRPSEADRTIEASSSAAAVGRKSALALVPASASLLLESLPQYSQGDESDQSDAEGEGRMSGSDGSHDTTPSFAFPDFATHLSVDAAAANLTPLPTVALHAYVTDHLLPRLGWQVSKYQGKDAESSFDDSSTRVVASVSLSISFEAMLKLFVAHVDTQEPRTSFRIPICVRVTRKPDSGQIDDTTSSRGVYHAHVIVGAAVPNVMESRQSVQLAAAEYLLRQSAGSGSSRSDTAAHSEGQGLSGAPMAAETATAAGATVHLSRTSFVPCDTKARQTAVHSVSGVACGQAISASVEKLLVQQESPSDTFPPLVFRVAAPVSAVVPTAPGNGPLPGAALVVIMAKMEHLNATSAVAPYNCMPSSKVSAPTTDAKCTVASLTETATPCRWLLEMLSPREMLQLDLLFACFPSAIVLLHRVQLSERSDGDGSLGQRDKEEDRLGMEVLAVEELTLQTWGLSRQHLQRRPAESLITTPSPSEVLATSSWDLLYDTLAWMLDTTARRVAYALESEDGRRRDVPAEGTNHTPEERYMYLVLSNHANLVNTSASTKLYTKKRPENAPEPVDSTVIASSYTESRFAVRYVVQDTVEIYPDYEPRAPITLEAANLRFLEKNTSSSSDEDSEGDTKTGRESERGVSKVASRLYRDPHTWNAETIPFTLPRTPEIASPPT